MGTYHQMNDNVAPRGSFLYASPLLGSSNSSYGRAGGSSNQHPYTFNLSTSSGCFQSDQTKPIVVKTESNTYHHQHPRQQPGAIDEGASCDLEAIKAKIIAHPQYSNLLGAYMDCQKVRTRNRTTPVRNVNAGLDQVGAPPDVMERLSAARVEFESRVRSPLSARDSSLDPELDQFMEAYCDMLVKYREELTRPIQEAMDFMQRIETQLSMICNGPIRVFNSDEKSEGVESSEEDHNSGGEAEMPDISPPSEDRELKNHLLRKYSGYLSSLKQELSKKKKKGKLPKEARQKLLSWWEMHYKWPYPSETEKVALAESTGLDQKQINNWFINQRKRHWKPSEDMQFMVMDGMHTQNSSLYMDGHYMGESAYRLGPQL